MPLRRGDFVTLTIGAWTARAMVGLASENGVSLIVLFDGAAPVGGGYALGMLALLQQDAYYVDIVTHTPVSVTQT